MAFLDVFSRVVEGIGAAAIVLRGQDGRKVTQAFGANPTIPAAKAQGSIPTLKMPTARGWAAGKRRTPLPVSRSTRSRPISSILDGSACCRMATCSQPRRF